MDTSPHDAGPAAVGSVDELTERISLLTALCAEPPDEADVAELTGLLGDVYLELYERDGAAEALDLAIDTFHRALARAPDHPNLTQWCYGLGIGYAERSSRSGSLIDHDRAVEWLGRLHATLSDHDPGHDYVTAMLMDAHWDRFSHIRYAGPCDAPTARTEAERVVAAIDGLRIRIQPELMSYATLLSGLAHLALFDESDARVDLAAGIERLAFALGELTPDAPRYTFAGGWLIDAYRRRAELDDDQHSLDLSIATGERVLAGCGPEDPEWPRVNGSQAMGYQARWRRTEDRADLDLAIARWRIRLESSLDPWPAAQCGELIRQRAELLEDATDLPEAIRLLDLAARSAELEDSQRWLRWFELGLTHYTLWQLVDEPASLAAAAHCLDRALADNPPHDDARLLVHNCRVTVACAAVRHSRHHLLTTPPPALTRLRQCLIDASADLDRADAALPELRAGLAIVLGHGEMFVATCQRGDIDRTRKLIRCDGSGTRMAGTRRRVLRTGSVRRQGEGPHGRRGWRCPHVRLRRRPEQ